MKTSILIILTGSLGDIARALCLPAHLKEHWPESRITWLIESKWKELVLNHPHIDRTVVFERQWRLGAIRKTLKALRDESYDIALDLQRILKSGLLAIASGAKRRIGFHPRNAKELNWIFNTEYIGYHGDHLSKLRHYLKFTKPLGLEEPPTLDFGLPTHSADDIDLPRIPPLPFIAIVAGSSQMSKDWHFEGYRELIEAILTSGDHSVVLIGDRTQADIARRLSKEFETDRVVDLVNRTSLIELVAILLLADAAVGPDTGTGHLAAAVKTPYVTLMGPTAPDRVAPYGCENFVVRSTVHCAPCSKKKCPEPQNDCMGDIGADKVWAMLQKALNTGQQPR